ncbi:MAG TPA: ribosome maturation factor RimM [Kofleriaceae bacterium]|nr:ribosome maturation factor RimM [Kofleriaceae bacterium]
MGGADRIEIGGIARAHGIRGEVVVHTHDPDSEILGGVETIFVDGVARKVVGARGTQKGWLVALEGVVTRNDAEALRGQVVEVARADLDLQEGDILLDDLIGCQVVLPDGRPWGTIASIEIGHQDLLVIHDGDIERLLPLVDELVPNIDIANRIVTVDPPEGLPESKRRE